MIRNGSSKLFMTCCKGELSSPCLFVFWRRCCPGVGQHDQRFRKRGRPQRITRRVYSRVSGCTGASTTLRTPILYSRAPGNSLRRRWGGTAGRSWTSSTTTSWRRTRGVLRRSPWRHSPIMRTGSFGDRSGNCPPLLSTPFITWSNTTGCITIPQREGIKRSLRGWSKGQSMFRRVRRYMRCSNGTMTHSGRATTNFFRNWKNIRGNTLLYKILLPDIIQDL